MTADAHFKDFVQRQQRPASADNAVDWDKKRDEWLTYLQKLYDCIAQYLDEYVIDGTVEFRESTIEINEENIGIYNAKKLVIVIGFQEIALTPVGTLLIGSKGRVDVEGSGGQSRLVLIAKDVTHPRQMVRVTLTTNPPGGVALPPEDSPLATETEWTWKIVSRPPSMQFIELNKDTLFEMLMEVSNG